VPEALALVTLAAVHWFHECCPGDHAACSCHHPGIAGSCGGCSGGKAGSGVAGDQLPTDGILPYRLGFTSLHYMPKLTGVPARVRAHASLGRVTVCRCPAGEGGEAGGFVGGHAEQARYTAEFMLGSSSRMTTAKSATIRKALTTGERPLANAV
jgi:hypothetical protein